jgi:ribosomal-protein-alanine N-acetyltransferase
MTLDDLAAVDQVERSLYPFPWTTGNFFDSLQAGYDLRVLTDEQGLVAYSVTMQIPDEMHLLNLSVAERSQGRGVGRWMMLTLLEEAAARGLQSMLLEVRPSNKPAQALYRSLGFGPIGIRRRYYPSFNQTREDAIVMRRQIDA